LEKAVHSGQHGFSAMKGTFGGISEGKRQTAAHISMLDIALMISTRTKSSSDQLLEATNQAVRDGDLLLRKLKLGGEELAESPWMRRAAVRQAVELTTMDPQIDRGRLLDEIAGMVDQSAWEDGGYDQGPNIPAKARWKLSAAEISFRIERLVTQCSFFQNDRRALLMSTTQEVWTRAAAWTNSAAFRSASAA